MSKQLLIECKLDGIHCPLCDDSGQRNRVDENGVRWGRDCECMPIRVGLRGLDNLREKAGFERYHA